MTMNIEYSKPQTWIVEVQGRLHLLAGSNENGLKVTISGYDKAEEDEGFSQDGNRNNNYANEEEY